MGKGGVAARTGHFTPGREAEGSLQDTEARSSPAPPHPTLVPQRL